MFPQRTNTGVQHRDGSCRLTSHLACDWQMTEVFFPADRRYLNVEIRWPGRQAGMRMICSSSLKPLQSVVQAL